MVSHAIKLSGTKIAVCNEIKSNIKLMIKMKVAMHLLK